MTRGNGSWLMAMLMLVTGVVAVAGCGQQKPAPAVDSSEPGVAANALEEDNKRTGVK